MPSNREFTPAAGRLLPTSAYDRLLALLTRERVWRARLLDALAPLGVAAILFSVTARTGLSILRTLAEHGVEFVLIGGMAGVARGSSYPSYDVDVVYARDRPNLERLARALVELGATLRGAPADLPFVLDATTLANGAKFTFDTPFGPLDVLADPSGAPSFDELRRGAGAPVEVEGVAILVSSLDHLIAMKEAAGRPKDLLMASEYRVISDELRRAGEESAED